MCLKIPKILNIFFFFFFSSNNNNNNKKYILQQYFTHLSIFINIININNDLLVCALVFEKGEDQLNIPTICVITILFHLFILSFSSLNFVCLFVFIS